MSDHIQDDEELQEINPELAVHFGQVETPVYEVPVEEPVLQEATEVPVASITEPAFVPTEEEDEAPTTTEEVQPFTPAQKKVNFTIERPVDGEKIPAAVAVIAFMRENPETFEEILLQHGGLFQGIEGGEVVTDKQTLEWLETLQNAIEHADTHGTPRRATEREGSDWRQFFMHEGSKIGPSRPKIKLSDKPSKSDMLSFLTRKSGMGATHEFPMPHTGIWVRLRTPTNTEVANMIQRLQNIAVRLGRETKGQGFSNRIAIYNNALTDLALQCITYTNMVATTPGDIEHRLSALDEPLLHHALATTMYPGGFNYRHACVADPSKCTHVEEAKLDMFSLTWFDVTQLNQRQRDMLRLRWSRQLRNEELDQYAQDTTLGRKPIKWFDNVGVRLRVPSIAERRDAGNRWIDGIVDITHSSFNEAPGDAGRNAYISRLGALTGARQYSHWVDAIYTREDGVDAEETLLTEDEEVIDAYLSDVMSDKKYAVAFEATVLEFIDEVILAMVAIPSWNCPVCDSAMAKTFHERFDHLIPIDVVSTFFTLAGQKVNQ
uniref:Uncharacterized protein n=1 Tax=Pseudomonas phage RVTF4 TaxID=3236931 RepID=A0AB39CCT1_9VIRU